MSNNAPAEEPFASTATVPVERGVVAIDHRYTHHKVGGFVSFLELWGPKVLRIDTPVSSKRGRTVITAGSTQVIFLSRLPPPLNTHGASTLVFNLECGRGYVWLERSSPYEFVLKCFRFFHRLKLERLVLIFSDTCCKISVPSGVGAITEYAHMFFAFRDNYYTLDTGSLQLVGLEHLFASSQDFKFFKDTFVDLKKRAFSGTKARCDDIQILTRDEYQGLVGPETYMLHTVK